MSFPLSLPLAICMVAIAPPIDDRQQHDEAVQFLIDHFPDVEGYFDIVRNAYQTDNLLWWRGPIWRQGKWYQVQNRISLTGNAALQFRAAVDNPRMEVLAYFPSKAVTEDVVAFITAWRQGLRSRRGLSCYEDWLIEAAIKENERALMAWTDLQYAHYPTLTSMRRDRLHRLRDFDLTPDEFAAGCMPCPVPLQYFAHRD